jgi:hypothetical protein
MGCDESTAPDESKLRPARPSPMRVEPSGFSEQAPTQDPPESPSRLTPSQQPELDTAKNAMQIREANDIDRIQSSPPAAIKLRQRDEPLLEKGNG